MQSRVNGEVWVPPVAVLPLTVIEKAVVGSKSWSCSVVTAPAPEPGGFKSVTSKKSSKPSMTGDSSTLDAF